MNTVISFVKRTRLFRVVTVFLAGVLVFFTTACSGGAQAQAMDKNPRPEVPSGAVTSPYEGGMNDFSDVDPRADASATNKKADALINRAEHNIDRATGNPVEVIKRAFSDAPEAGKNLGQKADDIGNKAKGSAEDFAQGTKRGVENIKENTRNATSDAPKTVDQAKQNAGNAAEDTANAAEKIKDNFQGAVQSITGNAKNTVDKASTSLKTGAQQAVENSKQAFGNNAEKID